MVDLDSAMFGVAGCANRRKANVSWALVVWIERNAGTVPVEVVTSYLSTTLITRSEHVNGSILSSEFCHRAT